MLTILVTMTVKTENTEEFETVLGALMPLLRETEPETLRFDYYRVDEAEGVYRLIETYASRQAFDLHLRNPATADQRKNIQRLLVERPEAQFLTLLGGK